MLREDADGSSLLVHSTYDDIRDSLLREFPWNFAVTRASLAADAAAPLWGYDFAYTLPADCLRMLEIYNANDDDWRNEKNKIVTDLTAPLEIKYIAKVLEGVMDVTFRLALAGRLAMDWAESLSQNSSVGQQMAALFRNRLQVARMADGSEDRIRVLDAPDFISARY